LLKPPHQHFHIHRALFTPVADGSTQFSSPPGASRM
jgi:hypothetical protein